ncbi:MAG: ribosome-associated translation inhibitor RaiA [Bdellovibrionales bacterium]
MKLDFKFRKMDWSDEMVEYVNARLSKLSKFEWQPLRAHVTFGAERHLCCVEIRLSGKGMTFKASSKASSYADGVDAAVAKLQRQLERKKHLVQNHLVFENTHEGKMERPSQESQHDHDDFAPPGRKVG